MSTKFKFGSNRTKITDNLYEDLRTYMAMRSHLQEAYETADDLNIKMAPQIQFACQEITSQIHSLNIYHLLLYSRLLRWATGWAIRVSIPARRKRLFSCLRNVQTDWGPPNLLFSGYRVSFLGGKPAWS